MLQMNEINDVYCDALVSDGEYLVFGSFWGRDTAVQELLARLTLSGSEGGFPHLSFDGSLSDRVKVENYTVKVGNPDRLDKLSGRMPKSNLFGDLVQVWLFDKKARTPDYVNRQAYYLAQPDLSINPAEHDDNVWRLVKDVCHIPLLDHWQPRVLTLMREQGWLKQVEGYQINLTQLTIPEEVFEEAISDRVRWGDFTIEAVA